MGSSRIQWKPAGAIGGAIGDRLPGAPPAISGVELPKVDAELVPPAVNAGAPVSAPIKGTRQFGQTVSPFAYQVQQLRQTARLTDVP